MDKRFLNYGMEAVFRDSSKDGLFFQFLSEYKEYFNSGKLNPACASCRKKYWSNYLKLFKMKNEVKCDYVLKAKYNGINLTPTSQPIRNGEMTNKIALELLKKHKKGAELFEVIPEKKEVKKKSTVAKKK
tara:strand:+ start:171 stop:560 length:390 start_codon:yes stop_codon:yes gene_type:complete